MSCNPTELIDLGLTCQGMKIFRCNDINCKDRNVHLVDPSEIETRSNLGLYREYLKKTFNID